MSYRMPVNFEALIVALPQSIATAASPARPRVLKVNNPPTKVAEPLQLDSENKASVQEDPKPQPLSSKGNDDKGNADGALDVRPAVNIEPQQPTKPESKVIID